MNISRPFLLVSSLATSLLLLSAAVFCSETEPPAAGAAAARLEPSAANPEPEPARREVAAAGYTAAAGSRFTFDLELEQGLSLGNADAAQTPSSQPILVTVGGSMQVIVLGRRDDQVLVGHRPGNLRITAQRDEAQATREWCQSLQRTLQQGFDVRMDTRGRPTAVRFLGQWTTEQRNFARAFLTAFRFEFQPAASWSSALADAMGQHTFGYRSEVHGDVVAVVRTTTAFVPRHAEGEANALVRMRGEATARFAPAAGWLQSACLDEELAWSWMNGALHVATWQKGTLACTHADTVPVQADWDGDFADVAGVQEVPAAGADPMRNFWDERLRGLDVTAVLAQLRVMLDQKQEPSQEYHELLQMLAELVRRDPAEAGRLAGLVQSARIVGQEAADVLAVLGMAGHEQAQAALTAVFENGLVEAGLRQAAVESMFQLEQPQPQLVASLQRSLDSAPTLGDLAGSAMLALGALGSRGAVTADGRPLTGELLSLEAAARRDGREGAWFEALGNTGDPAVLPLAQRLMESSDPVERGRALVVTRRVVSPAADELLQTAARGDASPEIRRQAVQGIGESTAPWTRDLLIERATADGDREVRRVALSALATRARTDAIAHRALVRRAADEPDAELQQMLSSLLARL